MKMDDTGVGNGKAPFGNAGEEEIHKEVQGEEAVGSGKGKGGMVGMVTYNSLTVDPVLGKLSAILPVLDLFPA